MAIISEVRDFIEQLGYQVLVTGFEKENIYIWREWFRGKVDDFHKYMVYNGVKKVCMTKKTLGMAKKSCEDWADLLMNEKVKINVEQYQDLIDLCLNNNNFRTKANELVELSFALGTGAFVEYNDFSKKGKVGLNFINAEMVFPLRKEDGEIVDVAFASEIGKNKYYVNIHVKKPNGKYQIENIIFNAEKYGKYSIDELPQGVQRIVESDVKLFQIIKPNIVNNSDINSAMGLSVYANAIDEMMDIDEKFDSYHNEFKLGKKRIFVDPSTVNVAITSSDGQSSTTPVFDTDEIAFYAVPMGDNQKRIEQTDFNLRVSEHSEALQDALNLFGSKVGFGSDFYTFRDGKVYTNTTDIISSNSKMFRRLKKHELVLEKALQDMVIAIIYLNTNTIYEGDIGIDFDDSIIEDKTAERQQYKEEVAMGTMSPVEYRMRVYGEDEETAKSKIPQAANVME